MINIILHYLGLSFLAIVIGINSVALISDETEPQINKVGKSLLVLTLVIATSLITIYIYSLM